MVYTMTHKLAFDFTLEPRDIALSDNPDVRNWLRNCEAIVRKEMEALPFNRMIHVRGNELTREEYDALPLFKKADYSRAHPFDFCNAAPKHRWFSELRIPTGYRVKCFHCNHLWDIDEELAAKVLV